jgi:transcriptional regulator with XRE-family HTH domain
MNVSQPGTFLSTIRKRHNRSLQDVADKMGGKGLSKQALSMIENGRMKIPPLRVTGLANAYGLSSEEQKEFKRIYRKECLVLETGLDREFGEAVLSLTEQSAPSTVFVIGGRTLILTSSALKSKAAEFLHNPDNQLIFIYPDISKLNVGDGPLVWFANTGQEFAVIRKSIQEHSARTIVSQIRFIPIELRQAGNDPTLLQVLSLCGPFTAMTIAVSRSQPDAVGYIYVDGPKDRWVLLKPEHTQKALSLVSRLSYRDDGGLDQERASA